MDLFAPAPKVQRAYTHRTGSGRCLGRILVDIRASCIALLAYLGKRDPSPDSTSGFIPRHAMGKMCTCMRVGGRMCTLVARIRFTVGMERELNVPSQVH